MFGPIPHQVCEFHILADLTKVVLRALARVRKRLAEQVPKLPRGRPKNTPEARRRHRRAQAIHRRIAELFEHRYLIVRHHLTTTQRTTLRRLSRGRAQLRSLRTIMDFDRRCRTDTALAKLSQLRAHVRRFRSLGKCLDQLNSPNLEKALTFLDERRCSSKNVRLSPSWENLTGPGTCRGSETAERGPATAITSQRSIRAASAMKIHDHAKDLNWALPRDRRRRVVRWVVVRIMAHNEMTMLEQLRDATMIAWRGDANTAAPLFRAPPWQLRDPVRPALPHASQGRTTRPWSSPPGYGTHKPEGDTRRTLSSRYRGETRRL